MKKLSLLFLLLLIGINQGLALSPTANLTNERVLTSTDRRGFSFESIPARDAFFGVSSNSVILKTGIPVVVNEGTAVTTFIWTGIDQPSTYDPNLFIEQALNSGPGTLFLGIDGTSLSSAAKSLNFRSAFGDKAVPLGQSFTDDGSTGPTHFEWTKVNEFEAADIFDTQLSSPNEWLFTGTTFNSYTEGLLIRPATSGTLRLRAYAGNTDTFPIVIDTTYDILPGDVGNLRSIPFPNGLLAVAGDDQLLVMSGIDLFGGLQTNSLLPFFNQTVGFLKSDTFVLEVVDLMTRNQLDDYVFLNSKYSTSIEKSAGIVVTVLPTTTVDTITASEFIPGVDSVSNPTITTVGFATFSQNDLICYISNPGQPNANDNIYEVHSHIGNSLQVRGIGLNSKIEDFTDDQFVNLVSAGTLTKIGIAALKMTATELLAGFGNTTPINFKKVLTIPNALTQGSILHVDADGNVTEDNSNLFWDIANNILVVSNALIEGDLTVENDFTVDGDLIFADKSNGTVTIGNSVTGTDRFNVFGPGTGFQQGIASFYDSSGNIKFRFRDEIASSISPRLETESTLGMAFNTTTDSQYVWYVNGTSNEKMRLTSTELSVIGDIAVTGDATIEGNLDINGPTVTILGNLNVGGTIDGVVIGPASATDGALARYNSTSGKLLKDSPIIVTDLGVVTGITQLDVGGHIIVKDTGRSIFIGEDAGTNDDLTDNDNIAIGFNALNANISSANNIAIGSDALRVNTTGGLNVAIGNMALEANTGAFANIGIGFAALRANTAGNDNVGIGVSALALNTIGNNNLAIGQNSLPNNTTGSNNIAFGVSSSLENTTGSNNTAVGFQALKSNITGGFNVALGQQAGLSALGSRNVFIGFQAGQNEAGSNRLYIDGSFTSTPLIYGEFDNDFLRINGDLEVTQNLAVLGSVSKSIVTKTATYTLTDSDYTVEMDATSGDLIANLPTAVGIKGRIYVIAKTDLSVNTVTIDPLGSQQIGKNLTVVLTDQDESLAVQSNGLNWRPVFFLSNRYTDSQRQINYSGSTTGIIADVRDLIEISPTDNTKIRVKAPYTIRTVDVTTPSNITVKLLDVLITDEITHDIPPGFTYWAGVKDNNGEPLYNFHFTLEEFDLTEFAIIGKAFTDETVPLQLNGVVGTFWWEGWNYGKTLYDFATAKELSFGMDRGDITEHPGLLTYTREEGVYWRFMSYNDLKNPNKGTDPQTAVTAYFNYPSIGAFEETSTFEIGFIDILNSIDVTTMTRLGSTVTVDTFTDHGFISEQIKRIDGAIELDYNGIKIVTVVDSDTFTFKLQAGLTPATPATGTITVTESIKTVVPANKWSIGKVFHFASSNFEGFQRGKQTYDSLHAAKSRKGEEDLPLNTDLKNAAFTHIVYVKSGATDLDNLEEVEFERIDGKLSSGGDPLVSSLQNSGVLDWVGTDILTVSTNNSALFDVGQFRIGFVDRTSGEIKFIRTVVPQLGISVPTLTTDPFTYIGYNVSTDTVIQQAVPMARSTLDNIIPLGRLWHRSNTLIDLAQTMPLVVETSHDYAGQLLAFGALKQSGLNISANGTNQKVDLGTGVLEVLGGTSTSRENISNVQPAAVIPLNFTPVHRAATTAKVIFETVTSDINFDVFDDGSGALATLSNNTFGIHYFYIFPFRTTSDVFIVRGGAEYSTLTDAKTGLEQDAPPIPSDFNSGFLISAVLAEKGTTDLSAAIMSGEAVIASADRFGSFGAGGGGGGVISNLQASYEASTDPEILTNTIRGALTIRRGSAADTDNVIEIQDGAGNVVAVITGEGLFTLSKITNGQVAKLGNAILRNRGANDWSIKHKDFTAAIDDNVGFGLNQGGKVTIGATLDNSIDFLTGDGVTAPTIKVQILGDGNMILNNDITASQYNVPALNATPASATDTCTLGEIRFTATHIYVCSATNMWVRAALTTF